MNTWMEGVLSTVLTQAFLLLFCKKKKAISAYFTVHIKIYCFVDDNTNDING